MPETIDHPKAWASRPRKICEIVRNTKLKLTGRTSSIRRTLCKNHKGRGTPSVFRPGLVTNPVFGKISGFDKVDHPPRNQRLLRRCITEIPVVDASQSVRV